MLYTLFLLCVGCVAAHSLVCTRQGRVKQAKLHRALAESCRAHHHTFYFQPRSSRSLSLAYISTSKLLPHTKVRMLCPSQ